MAGFVTATVNVEALDAEFEVDIRFNNTTYEIDEIRLGEFRVWFEEISGDKRFWELIDDQIMNYLDGVGWARGV